MATVLGVGGCIEVANGSFVVIMCSLDAGEVVRSDEGECVVWSGVRGMGKARPLWSVQCSLSSYDHALSDSVGGSSSEWF